MPITKMPSLSAALLSMVGLHFFPMLFQFQTKTTDSPQKGRNKIETYNYMGTLHSSNQPKNPREYGFMKIK